MKKYVQCDKTGALLAVYGMVGKGKGKGSGWRFRFMVAIQISLESKTGRLYNKLMNIFEHFRIFVKIHIYRTIEENIQDL